MKDGAHSPGGAPFAIATYRLQLHPEFGLDRAAGVADYLQRLGISHLYCSPYLAAAPGSQHGYDVVDPSRVNPELGGEAARERLVERLQRLGMRQLIDVVPNHVATNAKNNPWFWGLLQSGSQGPFAEFFDVVWEYPDHDTPRLVLPILGERYGEALSSGALGLALEGGCLCLYYREQPLPLSRDSLVRLLESWDVPAGERDRLIELSSTADGASEDNAWSGLQTRLQALNSNPGGLHRLLRQQHYRLAYWRAADHDLNYRRFFDITSLIGLRMENERVFDEHHRTLRAWISGDPSLGLRVDHPDGLRDPQGYFARLRGLSGGAWTVGEKILEPGERLPSDWGIAGTTGYDFLRFADGVMLDGAAEPPLTDLYQQFTGERRSFAEIVLECKRLVLSRNLRPDVGRLALLATRVVREHPAVSDYTTPELADALSELAASLPVYRTYLRSSGQGPSAADQGALAKALATVRHERADIEAPLLEFLSDALLLRSGGEKERELALRFQQLSGAAMAKGLEDTAFYRYYRLISLNEVGGDPSLFGVGLPEFHSEMRWRQRECPYSMNATSTHDTKRSEEVRLRIAQLAQIPERWQEQVWAWGERHLRYRVGDAPDRNDEYFLYQTLLGSWPIPEERLLPVLEKSVREAKLHSSWRQPDSAYEQGFASFARALLSDQRFLSELDTLVQLTRPAARLALLSQTAVKLTAPGVPDFYQGLELWDNSLVDPDNRRPVDFAERRRLLAVAEGREVELPWASSESGLGKLALIHRGLRLRRSLPQCFSAEAGYFPLEPQGPHSDRLIGYLRSERVALLAPRFQLSTSEGWEETVVQLPSGSWTNAITGEHVEGGMPLQLPSLLRRFPVALLAQAG